MKKVYVNLCEKNKWYVGISSRPEIRYEEHSLSKNEGAEWTRKFQVISCIFEQEGNEIDESILSSQGILLCGDDNLRGGPWAQETLNRKSFLTAEKPLVYWGQTCHYCGLYGHWVKDCPVNKEENRSRSPSKACSRSRTSTPNKSPTKNEKSDTFEKMCSKCKYLGHEKDRCNHKESECKKEEKGKFKNEDMNDALDAIFYSFVINNNKNTDSTMKFKELDIAWKISIFGNHCTKDILENELNKCERYLDRLQKLVAKNNEVIYEILKFNKQYNSDFTQYEFLSDFKEKTIKKNENKLRLTLTMITQDQLQKFISGYKQFIAFITTNKKRIDPNPKERLFTEEYVLDIEKICQNQYSKEFKMWEELKKLRTIFKMELKDQIASDSYEVHYKNTHNGTENQEDQKVPSVPSCRRSLSNEIDRLTDKNPVNSSENSSSTEIARQNGALNGNNSASMFGDNISLEKEKVDKTPSFGGKHSSELIPNSPKLKKVKTDLEGIFEPRKSPVLMNNSSPYKGLFGANENKSGNDKKIACFCCGSPDHLRSNCPYRDSICHKCHKKGHWAKCCPESNHY